MSPPWATASGDVPVRPARSAFLMIEAAIGSGEFICRVFRLRLASSCHSEYQKLGQMGKKILKKILALCRGRFSFCACGLLLSLLVGGCEGDLGERLQSGKVLAWYGLQGRWVGSVVPTEPTCGPPTQGLMTIGKKGFGLDPFQSTAVIHGEVSDDGHLHGSLIRQGADHQDLSIGFEGMAAGSDAISGTLQSGRCHWRVTLRRG
jgi:hypothetical protein